MSIQVTIIGLRQTGASIGLALAKLKEEVTRIGSDTDDAVNHKAARSGVVQKAMISLPAAARGADLVILALPVEQIRETMEILAPDLKPGAVLVDTSPAVTAAAGWAQAVLPGPDRYFVSMVPSFSPSALTQADSGLDSARADLFQNSLMFISCPPGTDESALELVSNLAEALGASPLFSDMAEVEGLAASALLLPELTAAALVNAVTSQPGWREARKLAGPAFAQSTQPAAGSLERKPAGQAALLNGANAARMIDLLIAELERLRDALQDGDAGSLQAQLTSAQRARAEWLAQRQKMEWEKRLDTENPITNNFFGRMFGLAAKKPKKPNQEEKS